MVVLSAGGNWNNSSSCGSRARNANNSRSNVNANNGGRGVILPTKNGRLGLQPCRISENRNGKIRSEKQKAPC